MDPTEILKQLQTLYHQALEKEDIKTAVSLLKLIGQERGMFKTYKSQKISSVKDLTDDQIEQILASMHHESAVCDG
ncbi:MAG: hypothetical protein Q8K36_04810 [Alphaproteobacteria bacterium]|nr:hypothetical protein [Alphaproteobacteria bacterium]